MIERVLDVLFVQALPFFDLARCSRLRIVLSRRSLNKISQCTKEGRRERGELHLEMENYKSRRQTSKNQRNPDQAATLSNERVQSSIVESE